MKVHKGIYGVLGLGLLLATGCSGDDADPAAAPEPTIVIEEREPTAQPTATAAPTATPVPTDVPTVTPEPAPEFTDDELAVIEAWERYFVLSLEARFKEPSAEALDISSYATGGAADGIAGSRANDEEQGQHIAGSAEYTGLTFSELSDDRAVLSICIVTDLQILTESGELRVDEGPIEYASRARLQRTEDGARWIVAATEFLEQPCER